VSEHIASPKLYIGIFLALMVGTGATVAAAYTNLGPFNIVIALAIATFKATLVVLFFMHAKYSPGRTQLVIFCAVFWLGIMLALTLSDYTTRHELTQKQTRPPALVALRAAP
jgi:cytochrome c oxidase subunit IV